MERKQIPDPPATLTPNQRVIRYNIISNAEKDPRLGSLLEHCLEAVDQAERFAELESEILSARFNVAELELDRDRTHFRNSLKALKALKELSVPSEKTILSTLLERVTSMNDEDKKEEWVGLKDGFLNDGAALARLSQSKSLEYISKCRRIILKVIFGIENKDALLAARPDVEDMKKDVEALRASFKPREERS